MKRVWIYLMSALVASGTLSCVPSDLDEGVLATVKPTDPAFVAFSQSLKSVTLSVGALVDALNLSEYIAAPEEERLSVEDLYYPYEKVREEGEGKWRIYNDRQEKQYRLLNGLTLDQAGAEWEVVKHEMFFVQKTAQRPEVPEGHLLVRSLGEDLFEVELKDVTMCVSNGYRQLWNHITQPESNYYNGGAVVVDGTFKVTTNNSAFRAQSEEGLNVQIEGSGEFRDASGAFYSVSVEITDPLKFEYGTNGFPCGSYGTGALELTVRTSPVDEERVEVEMLESRIGVSYYTGGRTFHGAHYWMDTPYSGRYHYHYYY